MLPKGPRLPGAGQTGYVSNHWRFDIRSGLDADHA